MAASTMAGDRHRLSAAGGANSPSILRALTIFLLPSMRILSPGNSWPVEAICLSFRAVKGPCIFRPSRVKNHWVSTGISLMPKGGATKISRVMGRRSGDSGTPSLYNRAEELQQRFLPSPPVRESLKGRHHRPRTGRGRCPVVCHPGKDGGHCFRQATCGRRTVKVRQLSLVLQEGRTAL